jgi:hypothetical protein
LETGHDAPSCAICASVRFVEVSPLAYCLARLVQVFDAESLTDEARSQARAEVASIPDDVTGVLVCGLCGQWYGWVA